MHLTGCRSLLHRCCHFRCSFLYLPAFLLPSAHNCLPLEFLLSAVPLLPPAVLSAWARTAVVSRVPTMLKGAKYETPPVLGVNDVGKEDHKSERAFAREQQFGYAFKKTAYSKC